jgi:hypothetical protein
MAKKAASGYRTAVYAVLQRDGTGPEYPGWSDGSLRDGWEAPLFEHRQAMRILHDYWKKLGWRYDPAADLFILNAPAGSDEEFITVVGRWIEGPRGLRKVYDVAWGWPWVEMED